MADTKKIIQYLPEILSIARNHNVSWNIAADMFVNNIQDQGFRHLGPDEDQYMYCGVYADKVDYVALAKEIDVSTWNKQAAILNEFNAMYRANMKQIQKLWKVQDVKGLHDLGDKIAADSVKTKD